MEETRWLALVQRLEPAARANPAAYRRRVIALALLGYVFIAALLAVLLALGAVVVVIALHGLLPLTLLIPILALTWIIVRSLYVKLEPPDGIVVSRAEVPALFLMLDEVRRAIAGPRVSRVLVDGDANASVTQLPRVGGLLGTRNYLVLGFPLFAALSADEFRAIVAHELGHLSRAHGRFGTFVYRVNNRWGNLVGGLEARESTWTGLVRRFLRWYWPYFSAYTHPVLRAHELEADDASAAVAGREAAVAALVTTELIAGWLSESYWSRIFTRVNEEPLPPGAAFAPMTQTIAQARAAPDLEQWHRSLLELETDPTDSHPSLAERLAHLGFAPEEVLPLVRRPTPVTAASCYLGEAAPRVVAELDRGWHEAVAPEWEAKHAELQREKEELERLEEEDRLGAAEQLRRAELTEAFREPDEALGRYRELVDTENDSAARLAIGRLLLERHEDEGLQWLDEVIDRDPSAVLPACFLACTYLDEHGREQEAEVYRTLADEHAEMLEAAEAERSTVTVVDRLEPPDLPDELLGRIRENVSAHEEIAEAYLVRKRTRYFDEEAPFFVLGIVPKSFRAARKPADADCPSLVQQIADEISLDELTVLLLRKGSALEVCFEEVAGANLLDRRSRQPVVTA